MIPGELLQQLGPIGAAVVAVGYLFVEAKWGTFSRIEENVERQGHKLDALGVIVRAMSGEMEGIDEDAVEDVLVDNGLRPDEFLEDDPPG